MTMHKMPMQKRMRAPSLPKKTSKLRATKLRRKLRLLAEPRLKKLSKMRQRTKMEVWALMGSSKAQPRNKEERALANHSLSKRSPLRK